MFWNMSIDEFCIDIFECGLHVIVKQHSEQKEKEIISVTRKMVT